MVNVTGGKGGGLERFLTPPVLLQSLTRRSKGWLVSYTTGPAPCWIPDFALSFKISSEMFLLQQPDPIHLAPGAFGQQLPPCSI